MIIKLFSLLFLGVGVFILVQVSLPYLSYKLWEIQSLDQTSILVSPRDVLGVQIEGVTVEEIGDFPAFISSIGLARVLPYQHFSITVPSLKIKNLMVAVSSNNFDQGLAQLPGTALPGERGNVFISGHSSLPQITNTPRSKTPFFNLPSIKKQDEIIVKAQGQEFVYIVDGIKVVNPKEVGVISPPDATGRYLTLMTCVPPGFNTKRLVVLAKLKG
jgi:LPXTG-site transpeptidase (sortase) family protein